MLMSGNIKYKRSVCLTEEILRNMDTILCNYYDTVLYNCCLANDDFVVFSTLKELLLYDNHNSRKIQYLTIIARSNIESNIKCEIEFFPKSSFWVSNDITVNGFINLDKHDDILFLKNKIYYILNTSELSMCYTIFSKFTMSYIPLAYLLIKLILYIINFGKYDESMDIALTFNNIFYPTLLAFLIVVPVYYIVKKIWDYLFPPIIYKWGAQTFEANKKSNLRQQILWGIIISLLVSLVGSFIWSKLYN